MGIDYSGGMIVGELGSELKEPDDYEDGLAEWAYDNGMSCMSLYYDASHNQCFFGFLVPDVLVSDMNTEWLAGIMLKAAEFTRLTGVPARLIGTQDIT